MHALLTRNLSTKLSRSVRTYWFIALIWNHVAANAADGPAIITVQPVDATAREGETATFRIQIDGTLPLTITWFRNGASIGSSSSPTLVTAPLTTADDSASFSASVANALGSASSTNAVLTVKRGILVTASANHANNLVLYRGWPLVVEVGLVHPEAFNSNAVPIVISATNGPWSRAVQLNVRDSKDLAQTWSFHSTPFTNETLQLDASSGGRLFWWLTPAETAQLPLGTYQITAVLNTTNATKPDAWKGALRSMPILLLVTNEPPLMDEIQEEGKRRLFANCDVLLGEPAQAQLEIDALLAAYPTNIGGLMFDARLKYGMGLFDSAMQSVQQALEQVAVQSPNATEPPRGLFAMETDLEEILAPPIVEATLADGQMVLGWTAHPHFSYRLEATSDLISWSVLATNFNAVSNRYSFTLAPSLGRQFFRVTR